MSPVILYAPAQIMGEFNPKDPDVKAAFKEGLQEWLDGKFSQFGKFAVGSLCAAAFAGVVYLALIGLGWHKP